MHYRPTHPKHVRIRNQLANQGFQVHPIFKDESGTPADLEQFFEPWRFSLIIVSDGTDRFYRLERGEGWAINYVRFKEVPEDIDIIIEDDDIDDGLFPGERTRLNYLAPGTVLRSVVVTDRIREQPGINAAFGITTPSGERVWTILPVHPIQAV